MGAYERVAIPKIDLKKITKPKLGEEYEALRLEFNKLAKDPAEARTARAKETANLEVAAQVDDVTVPGTVERINEFETAMRTTLSNIRTAAEREVEQLDALRTAIDVNRAELEKLHNIDVTQTVLSDLVASVEIQKDELEVELAALEATIEEKRAAWEQEVSALSKQVAIDRKEEAEKYAREQTRKRAQDEDEYQEAVRANQRKIDEVNYEKQKVWRVREETLAAAEQELASLRQQVATWDETLATAIKKEVGIAQDMAETKHKHELELIQLKAVSDINESRARANQFEEAIAAKNRQIEALEVQLSAAYDRLNESIGGIRAPHSTRQ